MYTIKQAAARTGVAIPTIRAWERRYGVVAPTRTAAGYRLYDDDTLNRLTFIARAKQLGCSLEEITDLVEISSRSRRHERW